MQSGDIVFPSSFALVIKKINNFDAETGNVNMAVTVILRVKFTGYEDRDDIRDWLREDLKLRINEVETSVGDLEAKCVMVHSSDADKAGKHDMAQYTIRTEQVASVGDGDYSSFPFDTLVAALRVELSHFTLNDTENYRFDVYRQHNEVAWKSECDALAQFGIDYESCFMQHVEESKPHKIGGGKEIKEKYYPGFIFTLYLPRNPVQPSL